MSDRAATRRFAEPCRKMMADPAFLAAVEDERAAMAANDDTGEGDMPLSLQVRHVPVVFELWHVPSRNAVAEFDSATDLVIELIDQQRRGMDLERLRVLTIESESGERIDDRPAAAFLGQGQY